MTKRISEFWAQWKDTAIGKSLQDFFWTVLYSSVAAGLSAVMTAYVSGQTEPQVVWGVFYAGVSVAFLKSISLFIDKYKNPLVPNTPQG